MNSKFEGAGIVAAILGFIALLVFNPVITFGFAYLGGGDPKAMCGRCNRRRYEPDFQHDQIYPGYYSAGLCHPCNYRQIFQEFSNQ